MLARQAVFIIGEQRSGSNLLRLILGSHSKIFAPHPPHILQRFMPLLPYYKSIENGCSQLIDDILTLVNFNPIPWGFLPDKNQLKGDDLVALFFDLMDLCAQNDEADIWVCKSMQNVNWANQILAVRPNAKFIYLYRDPRDVAVSFKKTIVGEKHVYSIASRWAQLQYKCLNLGETLSEQQFIKVSYQQLVSENSATINRLNKFLAIDFETAMNSYYTNDEAKISSKSGKQWVNLAKPILTNNFNKYLQNLQHAEIEIIESVCKNVMQELGFNLETLADLNFTHEDIDHFRNENEQLKADIKSKHVYKTKQQALQQAFLKQLQCNVY